MDIEYFKKIGNESVAKKEMQENFTNYYDETKVIDIKAMGLVKKRKREDLEKDPLTSNANGNSNKNGNGNIANENQENKDVVNEKILK